MWPFGSMARLVMIAIAIGWGLASSVSIEAQPPDERSSDDEGERRGRRGGRRGGGEFGGRFGGGRGGFGEGGEFQPSPEMIERMRERFRQFTERGGQSEEEGNDRDGADRSNNNVSDRGESKETEFPAVERPTVPPRVPDPRELKVSLDDRGRVPPFAFVGQPWTDVLQWLANLYGYSLDWQEMPGDYINLVSDDSETLDEVRDLINRQLLARGFTTLVEREVISVFRIRRVEPSLVRRLTEDELYDLRPYELAKVSFELPDGMQVDRAAEDVQKILSSSARVFPLASTRRLLVLDVVANLRNVSALFNEERNVAGMPREFVLRYARGQKVIETLYVILGINPDQQPQQMDVRVQRQRWEAIEEVAQRGGDVRGLIDGPKVYLAYNPQRNSVLANAPPEQMRIIAQAVKSLDVPAGEDDRFFSRDSLDGVAGRAGQSDFGRYLENYQLVTADPDRMLINLEEVGGLSPWTELRSDPTSKSLFVRATAADHEKVKRLIGQLDGAGRTFHVIPLRRLPADQVAVTIQQMLVRSATPDKNQDSDRGRSGRSRGGRSSFFSRLFQQQDDSYDPTEGFRVSADLERNRLLLWANEDEVSEVRSLLAQLGESEGDTFDNTYRVIDVERGTANDILDKLRRAWAEDNQLIIEGDDDPSRESSSQSAPASDAGADRSAQQANRGGEHVADTTSSPRDLPAVGKLTKRRMMLAQYKPQSDSASQLLKDDPGAMGEPSTPADNDTVQSAADSVPQDANAPPVRLTRTPDGKLLITSEDTEAVRRVEELIRILEPKNSPFEVFKINNVPASSVWLQLTEYFQDELADGSGQQGGGRFGGTSSNSSVPFSGLAERRNLRILYDYDSNVVLVANATPSQIFEIGELIRVFDKPKRLEAYRTRRTAIIPMKHSEAATVAATIKDVYRDLLSSRDREFQNGNNREQAGGVIRMVGEDTVIRYGTAAGGQQKQTDPIDVGFDGALSVGVDTAANAVVISAEEPIFDAVVDMARELDVGARVDTRIIVRRLNGSVDGQALQTALANLVGATSGEARTTSSSDDSSRARNRTDRESFDRSQFGRGQFNGGRFGGGRFGRGQDDGDQADNGGFRNRFGGQRSESTGNGNSPAQPRGQGGRGRRRGD